MPKDLNKEIKMLLTLLTPIEFTETFEIRDALIEGAKIEISDSKITLAKLFSKKLEKLTRIFIKWKLIGPQEHFIWKEK